MPIERFPNASQTQILQAVFAPAKLAGPAMRNWVASVDLDNVDWVEQRLVPHVYERMRTEAIEHPRMDVIKGVHRYWWFRNSKVLGQLPALLSELQQRGVEKTMLLKGAALASFYYQNVALRPMNDIDLMLPPEEATTAINALLGMGFTAKDENVTGDIATWSFQHYTRMGFSHPEYGEVDLHWEMLSSHNHPDVDQAVWKNAQPKTLGHLTVYVPRPEDLLLHVIDHGLSGVPLQTVWWVADAYMLLSKTDDFDWQYFYQQAQRVDRGLIVTKALAWLAKNIGIDTQAAEQAQRINARDRAYAAFRARLRQHSAVDRVYTLASAYNRHTQLRHAGHSPKSITDFLCQRWGEENPRALVGLAYRKYRHLA